ncbi:MAG: translational machinery protein [Polyangiaceae bacterium]
MSQHHVAVWIDHKEAKIYQIDPESFEMSKVVAPHHHVKRKEAEQGKHTDVHGFFNEVAVALKGTAALLIVGPASAKLDFIRHLQRHDHALEATICGVETLDHPSDAQLVAYVHHYFNDKDRAGKASA